MGIQEQQANKRCRFDHLSVDLTDPVNTTKLSAFVACMVGTAIVRF